MTDKSLSKKQVKELQQRFLAWYDAEKRDLPWRENTQPYRVWISEIMLQQTQVNTVIPYFNNFMALFPTIEILANAPAADLMKAWEGLGYYSRARNIQAAAQQVVEDFEGIMPNTAEKLLELKGIGPYTSGAIASISFKEVVPAVDGNVMRVMSRLFKIDEDIANPKTRKTFEKVTAHVIDAKRPGDFNQAIMDLGSRICTPKIALCEQCPLQDYCQSFADQTMLDYPVKLKKIKQKPQNYVAIYLRDDDKVAMVQRPSKGLLANLWTFPMIQTDDLGLDGILFADLEDGQKAHVLEKVLAEDGLKTDLNILPDISVKHVFSHLKWDITIFTGEIKMKKADLKYFSGQFYRLKEIEKLAEPTLQKKIWKALHESSQ